jgi:hypothetical protein
MFVCAHIEDCHVDLLFVPALTVTLQVLQIKPRGGSEPPASSLPALCRLSDIEYVFLLAQPGQNSSIAPKFRQGSPKLNNPFRARRRGLGWMG